MLQSITDTMLLPAMVFSGTLINTGVRVAAFAERVGANDTWEGVVERSLRRLGQAITFAGERLAIGGNRVAMWCGYEDGELSGIVAWPAASPSH